MAANGGSRRFRGPWPWTALAAVVAGISSAPVPVTLVPGRRPDSTAVDPCAVAPAEQLRFVVTAGLGRLFPIRWSESGETVSLTEPDVIGAGCPSLHVEIGLRVTEDPSVPRPELGAARRAHATLRFGALASFTRTPHSAEALKEASLCLRKVDEVRLISKDAPSWLTGNSLQAHLGDALGRQRCFDITSLVYVFLRRGGVLIATP